MRFLMAIICLAAASGPAWGAECYAIEGQDGQVIVVPPGQPAALCDRMCVGVDGTLHRYSIVEPYICTTEARRAQQEMMELRGREDEAVQDLPVAPPGRH